MGERIYGESKAVRTVSSGCVTAAEEEVPRTVSSGCVTAEEEFELPRPPVGYIQVRRVDDHNQKKETKRQLEQLFTYKDQPRRGDGYWRYYMTCSTAGCQFAMVRDELTWGKKDIILYAKDSNDIEENHLKHLKEQKRRQQEWTQDRMDRNLGLK